MLTLFLLAQLSAGLPRDSTYATPALRTLVEAVSRANRRPPAELRGYTSRIETEVSLLIRDSLGREQSAEVEQLASRGAWERGGQYDLHVIGYRSQSVGVPYSTLTIVRGWTVPTLYGERLSFGAYFTRARRAAAADTLRAPHPFAGDRDRFYRYTGGDTVTVLQAGPRRIPIVRIRVSPAASLPENLNVFDGEIDVDADRKQIVRMRGRVVTITRASLRERLATSALGMVAAAYIEFVNSEIAGKYWLPTYQRTEFQAGFALFGNARPVFRIVSNVSDITVTDSLATGVDSAERRRVTVTWAPDDSVDRFADWRNGIGTQSSAVNADDFADLAPDAWRTIGPPRVNPFPATISRMARFNRVEGLFLGIAPSLDFRSAKPGLTLGASAGWAFTEKTARGGAFARYARGSNIYGARAERALVNTNDFAMPMSDDPGFGALLGSVDNYDYVDRSVASASITRLLGSVNTGLVTIQGGAGRDRGETARLRRGLFGSRDFQPNRGVANGAYLIASADAELHPGVTGDFVTPGFGGRLHYELASGELRWQRLELSVGARKYLGPVSFGLHGDGGLLAGKNPPPQQLFELGGNALLPGYEYKEFAGDRAALVRTFASYRFNVLKRPIRVQNYYLPGISPGIALSLQGGWTELSSAGAQTAARALGVGPSGGPLARPTNGMRATAGGGLTFFSDLLHIGAARAVDRPAPWRFVLGFGSSF